MRFFKDGTTVIDKTLESQCDEFLKSYGVDPKRFNGVDFIGRLEILEDIPRYENEFMMIFRQKGKKHLTVTADELSTIDRHKALIYCQMKLDFNDIRKKG